MTLRFAEGEPNAGDVRVVVSRVGDPDEHVGVLRSDDPADDARVRAAIFAALRGLVDNDDVRVGRHHR